MLRTHNHPSVATTIDTHHFSKTPLKPNAPRLEAKSPQFRSQRSTGKYDVMSNLNVGNVLDMIQAAESKINRDFQKSDFAQAQERKKQDLLIEQKVNRGHLSTFIPPPRKIVRQKISERLVMVKTINPNAKYYDNKLQTIDNKSVNERASRRISAMEAIVTNYNHNSAGGSFKIKPDMHHTLQLNQQSTSAMQETSFLKLQRHSTLEKHNAQKLKTTMIPSRANSTLRDNAALFSQTENTSKFPLSSFGIDNVFHPQQSTNATQLSQSKLTTQKVQQLNEQSNASFKPSPPQTKKSSAMNALSFFGGLGKKEERRDSQLPLITDPQSSQKSIKSFAQVYYKIFEPKPCYVNAETFNYTYDKNQHKLPSEAEIQYAKNHLGPNARFPSSPLGKMKAQDTKFEEMLTVVKGIRQQEENNPNAYGWHLVNATAKFEEQDQIEKMKKAQQNVDFKKMEAKLQKGKQGHGLLKLQSEEAKNLPSDPLKVAPKQEMPDMQDSKIAKQERDMMQYHQSIDNILDRYNSNRMTISQASKSLIRNDIQKWANKMRASQASLPQVSSNLPRKSSESPGGQSRDGESRFQQKEKTPRRVNDKICDEILNNQSAVNLHLTNLAKELFRLWDERNYGKLPLRVIVKNFMALGFANSEDIIIGFFSNIIQKMNPHKQFSIDDLREYDIYVNEFVDLFDGDEYQQKILNALNVEVRHKNFLIEKARKQKIASQKKKDMQEQVVLMFRGAKSRSETIDKDEKIKMAASTFISKLRSRLGSKVRNVISEKAKESAGSDSSSVLETPRQKPPAGRRGSILKTSLNSSSEQHKMKSVINEVKTLDGSSASSVLNRQISNVSNSSKSRKDTISIGRRKTALMDKGVSKLKLVQIQSAEKTLQKSARSGLNLAQKFGIQRKQIRESKVSQQKKAQQLKLNKVEMDPLTLKNDQARIDQWNEYVLQKELRKEYDRFEDEYKSALRNAHRCQIEEIIIDQDDMLRTSILELLLYDIAKKYYAFKEDITNQRQLHSNATLDQKDKLDLVRKHKMFQAEIREVYGKGKGQHLFNSIMRILTGEPHSQPNVSTMVSSQGVITEHSETNSPMLTPQIKMFQSKGAQTPSRIQKQTLHHFGLNPEKILASTDPEHSHLQDLIRQLVDDQFEKKKDQIEFTFPNEKIVDYISIMDQWWRSVDVNYSKQMTMNQFSQLMVQKGVVSKSFETIRMVKFAIGDKINQDGRIKLSQYQKVFSRAFLRGALMNIYYYLRKISHHNGDDRISSDSGFTKGNIQNALLHVMNYQRSLIIEGLHQERNAFGVDCLELVNVLSQQQQMERKRQAKACKQELAILSQQEDEFVDEEKKRKHEETLSKLEQGVSLRQIKQQITEKLISLKESPMLKITLRGINPRDKHKDLKAKREKLLKVVERFEGYQELFKNSVRQALGQPIEIQKEPGQTEETAKMRRKLKGMEEGVDLQESKISYKIMKDNLEQQLAFLEFLDKK